VCPWWLLEAGLLSSYRDREKKENKSKQNRTHIYTDVAVLESRHAFDDDELDVALGLVEIYFPTQIDKLKPDNLWNEYDADKLLIKTGILGDRKMYYKENSEDIDQTKVNKALTNWILNLAKVGFHLCQQ
jgi:CRISPR-associated protein Cmr2